MKVWITKWWATKGILCEEVETTYVTKCVRSRKLGHSFRLGFEAFVAREDAVKWVRELANRKLAALDRQKSKIRKVLARLANESAE